MLSILKRVGIIYGVVALFGLGTFLSTMFPLAGGIVIGSAILLFLSRLKLKPLPPCPHSGSRADRPYGINDKFRHLTNPCDAKYPWID